MRTRGLDIGIKAEPPGLTNRRAEGSWRPYHEALRVDEICYAPSADVLEPKASEKRECTDFDAFARPGIGRGGRVVESSVGGPARSTVLERFVGLGDRRHLIGTVGDRV